jgi:hypothetical protein
MKQLTKMLSQVRLVERVITQEDLENLTRDGKNVPIMMGQTFDKGQPADMIKYGLFIMELEDCFRNIGANPSSQWVLADHFMTTINKEKGLSESLSQRESRQKFLERINQVYGGKINVVYSSDLANQEEYKQILKNLLENLDKNPKFKQEMLSSIPEDRRKNPESLRYPLEELATIFSLGTRIKIGPKYEVNYDIPARAAAAELGLQKYVAIHLTNCFPLGNPIISKEDKLEIDSWGLTPYKLNSKRLKKYRLDPINGNLLEEEEMIMQTEDFRAIKDLIAFSLLARKRLTGEEDSEFIGDLNDVRYAKEVAYKLYKRYIKQPLTE